jgi:hypothetical protein
MVAVEVEGMQQREQRIRKRPRPTWDVAPSEPQVRPAVPRLLLAFLSSRKLGSALGFLERESASNRRLWFSFLFDEGFSWWL